MAFMLTGQFEAAWKESDAVLQRDAPDPNRFWKGEDLQGKRVIVRCLHGFGDAVQFLRYAPRLRAMTSRLMIEASPYLSELLRCIEGVEEVIPWGEEETKACLWDVQVELMELPYIFRTSLKELPLCSRYLNVPEDAMRQTAHTMGRAELPRIGVVWSSGEWNPLRSMPIHLLEFLLCIKGCEFWNLQGGKVRQQWETLLCSSALRDVPELCDGGLLPLAAVISQLDLVITVDTLAAHLAGALGVPAWIMLQKTADWRWMMDREDSPWYSSLRLFRQTRQGDWTGVVEEVQHALEDWAAKFSRRRLVA
jgi:hypothetical protein